MATPPLFVNRVNVALAPDTTLVILGAPAGPIQDGQIASTEVARLVMTNETFKEIAELFAAKVREIEAAARAAALLAAEKAAEKRPFESDAEDRPPPAIRLTH